jgi:hypothetical protein
MSLLVPWLVFPLALTVVAAGCGLLLERAGGARVSGVLLVPAGLAVIIAAGGLTTLTSATAPLTTPLVVALAVAGAVAGDIRRRPTAASAATGVVSFLAAGAPVLASGSATFMGYVKLDDSATFLALADRVMEHGRTVAGLAPSSYEATISAYLTTGYPIGSLIPLGVGHELTRQDAAWLYAPTLAFGSAVVALVLFEVLARVIRPAPFRAGAAVVASQAALLVGYAQWGGIKEITAAALIATCAALAARVSTPRSAILVAVPAAALLGAVSLGGLLWLPLAVAPMGLDPNRARRAAVAVAATAVLAVPALASASSLFSPSTSRTAFESGSELGNLVHPLSLLQLFGIWPSGDFRVWPAHHTVTWILVAAAAVAAAAGLAWAWRAAAWSLAALAATGVAGALVSVAFGSPWVAGKALAIGSPFVLAAAFAGVAWLAVTQSRMAGVVVGAVLVAGVAWSDALAYRDVNLAPRGAMAELATIGDQFAGDGPSLMTEYQPYGVRHFLRRLDPEGASELRRRPVTLRTGGVLGKGAYADLDAFSLPAILTYRTIVLRRSPAESRPPSPYTLVWRGRVYDVWQRPASAPTVSAHLPLGTVVQPGAVPACGAVLALARSGASLVAPPVAANIVAPLAGPQLPPGWTADSTGHVYPGGGGTVAVRVTVPRAGSYEVWLGGSSRRPISASVDGRTIGDADAQLGEGPQYLSLGTTRLSAGSHAVALHVESDAWAPGIGGPPSGLGPLILRPAAGDQLLRVSAAQATALCGRRLDWIESVPAGWAGQVEQTTYGVTDQVGFVGTPAAPCSAAMNQPVGGLMLTG